MGKISYMLIPQIAYNNVPPSRDRMEMVLTWVCKFYNEDKKAVLGRRKLHSLCKCRFAVAYILRIDVGLEWAKISKFMGWKDHTSAIHAVGTISDWMDTDERVFSEMTDIRMRLLSRLPLRGKRKIKSVTFLREPDLVNF